jgi:hypothetical protein
MAEQSALHPLLEVAEKDSRLLRVCARSFLPVTLKRRAQCVNIRAPTMAGHSARAIFDS